MPVKISTEEAGKLADKLEDEIRAVYGRQFANIEEGEDILIGACASIAVADMLRSGLSRTEVGRYFLELTALIDKGLKDDALGTR